MKKDSLENLILKGAQVTETVHLTCTREIQSNQKIDKSFYEKELSLSYQEGSKEGERIGYERGIGEVGGLITLLQTLTCKLMEQKKRLFDQLKPEIIEFAIAVCEKVLRKELSSPETFVRLLNSLLNIPHAGFRNEVLKIILAPDDFLMIEKYFDQIQCSKREIEGLSFQTDPLIRRGDCRIEGESSLLNHSIARELSDLSAKVLLR